MINLNELAKEVHQNAVNHGWWNEDRSFAEVIALCHSELSEALEEYRNESPFYMYFVCKNCGLVTTNTIECCPNTNCGETLKPEGIGTELADCIIRILDYCGKEEIDIEKAIRIKHEYNKTRPYKHGGKKI
jgi:NTP pyrophosphatase (non-canonical NTP hydrolase)